MCRRQCNCKGDGLFPSARLSRVVASRGEDIIRSLATTNLLRHDGYFAAVSTAEARDVARFPVLRAIAVAGIGQATIGVE